MALKEYAGNAPATRLSGTLASGTTTNFAVIASGGGGYPTGSTAPFVVVIDRGTATEEKILVLTRSGDTFTGLTRGYDGTSAQAHAAQAVVEHVFDAVSASEFSQHVNDDARDDHSQYVLHTELTALAYQTAGQVTTAAQAIADATIVQWTGHTFAISGDVVVPSGDVDYIVPLFVPVLTGTTVKLVKAKHRINSGTSATVKLQINGVDATGFTGISVTTASAETNPADISLADGDRLALVVTAVSGSPKNLTFTCVLEHG